MSVRRASIDHRLDVLAARTTHAKQDAMQGMLGLVLVSAAIMTGLWLWRFSTVRRDRRLLAASVRL